MPDQVLRNSRHERFAQELTTGKTADAAYVLAGYRENRSNAARLSANRDILKRVAEIQSLHCRHQILIPGKAGVGTALRVKPEMAA